jgi:hypothetical protein
MLQNHNFLCPTDISYQSYSCAALFRGPFSASSVGDHLAKLSKTIHFTCCIPVHPVSSVCTKSISNIPSVTFLTNSKSIRLHLRKISEQFSQMQSRRAYYHWFEREGMDLIELSEAENILHDVIQQYGDNCWCGLVE